MRFIVGKDGSLVPAGMRAPHPAASELSMPMVIRDHLDGVANPVNGKRYDSKSAYYRAVRAAGCEIVGNDTKAVMTHPGAHEAVKPDEVGEAYQKVRDGYRPAVAIEPGIESFE